MNDDLISRGALLADLREKGFLPAIVRRAIERAPAVDAVEVVRCCECKWWHEDDDVGYCDNPDGLDNYAKPDEFCSYRERKEGAE